MNRPDARDPVLRPLPRATKSVTTNDVSPGVITRVRPKATLLRTFARTLRLSFEVLRFTLIDFLERLRGTNSIERRATRLRQAFERVGGTLVKLGQQISLRADLLPFEYCRELSRMLDSVPPIDFDSARREIEDAAGASLEETFQAFDPNPIGSASVACVYQAILTDGTKVAVKVRRRGIGELFAADLRALSWLLIALEWLTVFRPGFSRHLRVDLREMLFEELDFLQEARYQELFRKYADEDGMSFFTAPAVIFGMCSDSVIVQEYVEGVWLSEVIAAVESNDPYLLRDLERKGVEPKDVSRNLMFAAYWSIHENMFFHADPHPANILVNKTGKLIFIDFGACGSTSQRSRRLQAQILHRFWRYDVEGAARAAISLIDPLPHIDTDELIKRAASVWWKKLYAMRSSQTPWWDRTTASIWISLLEVTREYQISINLDTLRAMRASLLYDTLAVRIWRDAGDLLFEEYERGARWRRARRFLREASKNFEVDLFATTDEALDLAKRLQYRLEEFADGYPMRMLQLPSKASYSLSMAISCALGAIALLVVSVAVQVGWRLLAGFSESIAIGPIVERTASHPLFVLVLAVYVLLYIRRIQFRLNDREEQL